MPGEEEVLLLPGLPLVNRAGENPEPDLWSFEIETAPAPVDPLHKYLPTAMIDFVHPGKCMHVRLYVHARVISDPKCPSQFTNHFDSPHIKIIDKTRTNHQTYTTTSNTQL